MKKPEGDGEVHSFEIDEEVNLTPILTLDTGEKVFIKRSGIGGTMIALAQPNAREIFGADSINTVTIYRSNEGIECIAYVPEMELAFPATIA